MFYSHNNFLNLSIISSLFSGRIITSSTGSCFSILSSLDFVTASAILFPKYSPALWDTFLEASSPVFNNCFLYFLAYDKNPYPLTFFLALGSIEYYHFYLLISNVKLTLSSISNGVPV